MASGGIDERPGDSASSSLVPASVLSRVGCVPLHWDLVSDRFTWWGDGPVAELLAGVDSGSRFRGAIRAPADFEHARILFDAKGRSAGSSQRYIFEYDLETHRDVEALTVEEFGVCRYDDAGRPQVIDGVIRPVANAVLVSANAERETFYTSLHRSRLMNELRLGMLGAEAGRPSYTFVLGSVDRLPAVNESFGYEATDDVLAGVGRLCQNAMRAGDMMARLSGNKFGILLQKCDDEGALLVGERLLALIRNEVIATASGPVQVTISLGAAAVPRHAMTMGALFARANAALRQAKSMRDVMVVYHRQPEAPAVQKENREWASEVVVALNERRFRLRFQPIVDAKTGKPSFFEALLRLYRSDGTIVPAHQFFPVADRLGLSRLIDHRVLELVALELSRHPELRVSMNVAPSTSGDPSWLAAISSIFVAEPSLRGRLTIEITENVVIERNKQILGFIETLQDLGCTIAIDDFGAGYTSFRHLRELPIQMIKIDGAYIRDLSRSLPNQVFVKALIDIARAIGADVVAEWVQCREDADLLRSWGVAYLQGEYFGLDQDVLDCLLLTSGNDAEGRRAAQPA